LIDGPGRAADIRVRTRPLPSLVQGDEC